MTAADLSALIDSTGNFVWSVDLEFRLVTFNKAWRNNFINRCGIEPAVGMHPGDVLPPERAARWVSLYERALKDGTCSFDSVQPDGRVCELTLNRIVVDGEVTGISVFGKDIADQKSAERDRALLASIVESSNDAIHTVTLDGTVLTWNRGAESLFGHKTEEIVGKSIALLAPPQREQEVRHFIGVVAQGGVVKPFETSLLARDGQEIEVSLSISPLRDAEGLVVGASGVAQDIRERKQVERELKKAEKRYREIFDEAIEGMFQNSIDGKPIAINRALARMLGYESPEDFLVTVQDLGQQVWKSPRDRVRFVRTMEKDGAVAGMECQLKRKDGSPIWVSLNCQKTAGADPQSILVDGFIEDITVRKQAEIELRRSAESIQESQVIGGLGTYDLDIASGHWTSSAVMDEIFGIGPDYEHTTAGWEALIHPGDRQTMSEYLELDVIGKRQQFDGEYRIVRHSDGEERWVHGVGKLEVDSKGRPLAMRGVIKDITAHKRAEMELRDSEGRYRATFEQAPFGIAHLTFDGRILRCNSRFAAFLGYSIEEVLTLSVDSATCRQDLAESIAARQRVASGDTPAVSLEKRYIRKDGSLTWGKLSISLMCDKDGNPLHFIALVEDINALKVAEEQLDKVQDSLRATEERYRTAFQTSHDAININRIDDGRYIDCNKAFLDIVGFTREEVIGHSSVDLGIWVEPNDRQKMVDEVRTHGSCRELEARFRRKNGEVFWGRMSASPIEIGGIPCVLTISRDISDSKAAELRLAATTEALRSSEERYRTAFETSLDCVGITRESDGLFLNVNQALLETLGYKREEIVGRTAIELGIWPNPQDRQHWAEIMRERSICRGFETQFRRKNGDLYWGQMSSSVMEIDGVRCILSITRDISAEKAAEELLTAAAEAVRVSEERYRKVFHTSLDPITISRLDTREYLDVNQAFLDLMGYEREEVIGLSSLELNIFADPRDRDNLLEILSRTSECRNLELQFRKKNGETCWGIMSVSLVEIEGVHCVLAIARDISHAKEAEDEIRNLAFYDPLTALPNRRLLIERLRQSVAAGGRAGRMRALLFVDLDNFKTLNDTLGHQTGDMLLQEAARRLSACVRDSDTVGRLGGDEFVLMLDDLSEVPEEAAAQAKAVGEKILFTISQPYLLDNRVCRSSASIGISVFGDRRDNSNEVLQQADIAMYQAKAAGRNTMRFFAPALQAAVNARAVLEEDLRQAIRACQFVLYYQPQIDRNRLVGAEALVRWNHPWRGILPPGDFIPLAEETGLILPLGRWVLESACAQIAAWAASRQTAQLSIAVNISARQFRQPDFVEQVLSALDRTGANPYNLKLELTESMLVENIQEVIDKMTELKLHGLRFSLDDFGTGYSSLAYLKRLPLDQLKIDRSFIRDILVDESSAAIAQTIVSLSRAMGLPVIAEGVETAEQREFLTRIGCHAFQGFLFSRPLPLAEFESQWLSNSKTQAAISD